MVVISYFCQILTLLFENPAVASDFAAVGRKLDPFLADSFGKSCSDAAE